jgi:hypothetical protein
MCQMPGHSSIPSSEDAASDELACGWHSRLYPRNIKINNQRKQYSSIARMNKRPTRVWTFDPDSNIESRVAAT